MMASSELVVVEAAGAGAGAGSGSGGRAEGVPSGANGDASGEAATRASSSTRHTGRRNQQQQQQELTGRALELQVSARIHSIVDRRQLQGCGKVKPKDGDDSTGDSGDGSGGDSAANLFYPNDRPRVVLYDVNHALVTYFCVFISAAILCASPVAVRGRSLVITLLPLVLPLTLYGYCVVQVVKGSGSNRSSISKKQDDVAPASFKARHLLQIIRSNVADIEEMGYGLSSVLGLEDDVADARVSPWFPAYFVSFMFLFCVHAFILGLARRTAVECFSPPCSAEAPFHIFAFGDTFSLRNAALEAGLFASGSAFFFVGITHSIASLFTVNHKSAAVHKWARSVIVAAHGEAAEQALGRVEAGMIRTRRTMEARRAATFMKWSVAIMYVILVGGGQVAFYWRHFSGAAMYTSQIVGLASGMWGAYCLATASYSFIIQYKVNLGIACALGHTGLDFRHVQDIQLWQLVRTYYVRLVMKARFGLTEWGLGGLVVVNALMILFATLRVLTGGFAVLKVEAGFSIVVAVSVIVSAFLFALMSTGAAIWTTQEAHVEMLREERFKLLVGTGKGLMTRAELTVEHELLEDLETMIKRYDVAPTVFGLSIKPGLLRVMQGYVASAGVALIGKAALELG